MAIMKAYLKEYKRIAKAGLLHASHSVMFVTAMFMFLFGKYLGIELEILIFILTPLGYMLDLDANKYVITYSMPVSLKKRIHILYGITILGSILSVMMVNLRYWIDGSSRSIAVSLFIIMMDLLGCNLYYYLFGSPEFKKDILDDDKKQLIYQCIVGALIGIGIAGKIKWRIREPIEQLILNLSPLQCGIMLIILGSLVIWETKYSINHLEKVIRDAEK